MYPVKKTKEKTQDEEQKKFLRSNSPTKQDLYL